jgi:hypothetical protein
MIRLRSSVRCPVSGMEPGWVAVAVSAGVVVLIGGRGEQRGGRREQRGPG